MADTPLSNSYRCQPLSGIGNEYMLREKLLKKFQDQHLQAKELFIFYAMGATQQPSLSKHDVHFQLIFLFSSADLTISKKYLSFVCWISTDVNKSCSSHMRENQGKQKASCCPKDKLKVHLLS